MARLLADIQVFLRSFYGLSAAQLPSRDKKLGLVLYMVDFNTGVFWKVLKRVGKMRV